MEKSKLTQLSPLHRIYIPIIETYACMYIIVTHQKQHVIAEFLSEQ